MAPKPARVFYIVTLLHDLLDFDMVRPCTQSSCNVSHWVQSRLLSKRGSCLRVWYRRGAEKAFLVSVSSLSHSRAGASHSQNLLVGSLA